ncbi:PAS domain S-box protein [Novosphingobium profundi]|uniref:methyl-accepting chemotaxis protein n=1 Tax=Novosphingobium profundi TaxID=1774954 RepID=UPI001BDB0ECF|nr:PAS domain S-box protein [Novosphingobium profundi]
MIPFKRHSEMSLAEAAGAELMQKTFDAVHLIVDGVIVECNPAYSDMMGYTREQIVGLKPDVLSPPTQPCGTSSAEKANEVIGQTLQNGRHRFEWTHLHRDGQEVPVLATLAVVEVKGQTGILCQLHDLSDQIAMTNALNEGLSALAAGDLTKTITSPFLPEYEPLREAFNRSLQSLSELVGGVIESTSAIRTGAIEIAEASEDLARRTESNAASLEETTAATSELDGRVKGVARNAAQTVARADETIKVVDTGRSITDEAVNAMARVADSAKGIDTVIEGLDKIAFQTRVLAMNAAVEAGRAGEAGRGFAVVADLVSALAMRSEEEAKRARDQLTTTQDEVGSAVNAVQRVDSALSNITENVGHVHKLLESMASDNQAQANAIDEVAIAINAMNAATQQNAAMVEETSAASRNLSTEVNNLSHLTQRFVTRR